MTTHWPVFREVEDIFVRDAWFRWRYNIRLQAGFAEHWLKQGDVDQAEHFAHRLRDTAVDYEAWKYVALADGLLARGAIARGKLTEGVAFLETALAQLRQYPCPIVTWKLESARAGVEKKLGDHEQEIAALERARVIIRELAAHVEDEELRTMFLNSPAVSHVFGLPDTPEPPST